MSGDPRLPALRRFAVAISILNVAGRAFLGFESSWAQLFVAMATAYAVELLLETIDARALRRKPEFLRGGTSFLDFLLPAHITACACSMLIYANDRLAPFVLAVGVGIGSKALFRAPVGNGVRHFLNPSNTGIAVTLLVFPWVGVAQPYQFTENVAGIWDWVIPAIIFCSGTFLNARYTKKVPLLVAWLGGFAVQALLRSAWFATPLWAPLAPMTGMAFVLFTFYMATDPATTPAAPARQVGFGLLLAAVYSALQLFHVVYGLFFALFAVCILRGGYLHIAAARRAAAPRALPSPLPEPVPVALGLRAADR